MDRVTLMYSQAWGGIVTSNGELVGDVTNLNMEMDTSGRIRAQIEIRDFKIGEPDCANPVQTHIAIENLKSIEEDLADRGS